MNPIIYEFTYLDGIENLSYFPNFIFILLALLLIWIGKKLFDLFTPYSLEYQLVKADNKAIAVAFVGYLGGVVVVLEAALEGYHESVVGNLIEVSIWGVIGILLLNIAGKMNDRLILRTFENKKELLEEENIAVGIAIAGSYMGSAMIIRSVIIGEPIGWVFEISLTIFYFLLGQLSFYLFSLLYQKITQYDFHREIDEGNAAAGISFAFNLTAIGILLSIPIKTSYSLVVFIAWFVLGSTVLAFFRFIVDRIIIPSEKLDEEIHQDQNWGIALLEGCFAIAAVVILYIIFVKPI
ncbi:MAG: DUF350 domain-containing protein [Proteobacteria bacterium]|nr:DUF350 domain-containing protein [Pseudomonadota bacterium]